MKFLSGISLLLPLCASLCGCPEDDIAPVDYTVELDNLVYIDNDQSEFAKGDTLWVNVQVPQQVNTSGDSYDIFELTNNEVSSITFSLEKEEEGLEIPLLVRFAENDIIAEFGGLEIDSYNNSRLMATIQLDNGVYRTRFGIVLKASGDFLLSESFLSENDSSNRFTLWFNDAFYENPYENVLVSTTFRASNEKGKFTFSVID